MATKLPCLYEAYCSLRKEFCVKVSEIILEKLFLTKGDEFNFLYIAI